MNNERLPDRLEKNPKAGFDSKALDRYEDEGGASPEVAADSPRGEQTYAPAVEPYDLEAEKIVVTTNSTTNLVQIHHREVPELQGEGATQPEAAAALADHLTHQIEGVADHFHRGVFLRVLDDVLAFVPQSQLADSSKGAASETPDRW